MPTSYPVGPLRVDVAKGDARLATAVRRELDPYRPLPGPAAGPPDLLIERSSDRPRADEIAGDGGDGIVSAVVGQTLHAFVADGWWSLRREAGCSTLTLGAGTPAWRVAGNVLRPLLQLALHDHGAVALHASTATVAGRGIAIAGWSESGKTETMLALVEAGGAFVSDKWTILDRGGRVATFPNPVFVRRWVLRYLPGLRASLSRSASMRLRAGAAGAALVPAARRVGRMGPGLGFLASTFERAASVADRLRFSPSDLASLTGGEAKPLAAPLATLVLLVTVPADGRGAPEVRDGDPRIAATRLARSAAYERRAWYELMLRAAYGAPDEEASLAERDIATETEMLRAALAPIRVLDVRAPFPTDPRRVADAVLRAL